MKKLLAFLPVIFFVACNTATTSSESSGDSTAASTSSAENVTYAYTPAYSADFEIGDSKYAQTVLDLWKDFDNNTFDNHKDAFADSIKMQFPDGSVMEGPRDSVIGATKAYRSSLKNVVSTVAAVTTLKPKGKDETWVCVWGTEVDTHNDNKVDSVNYNENWMFNKDGKIAYMEQLSAKPPTAK